LLARTPETI
jgi:hypothetical protein